MTEPRLREAARVITLDDHDRVLLLRYDDTSGGFWATPGGSLEPGEDHSAAARREIREELGIDNVDLGPHIAHRSREHHVAGQHVLQVERYYIAHIHGNHPDPTRATKPDEICAWRWWTLDELRATHQTIHPTALADLLTHYLTHGAPTTPATLTD